MTGSKIIRVKNKLGELLSKPGGITREDALEEAHRLIEQLRDEYEKAIPEEITRLEDMVALGDPQISVHHLEILLDVVDPLLTLTGTFGPPRLDAVVKRFCDLCSGMMEKGITAVAPLKVHLRAMRLVLRTDMPEPESTAILAELTRIHDHYGIVARSGHDSMPLDALPN